MLYKYVKYDSPSCNGILNDQTVYFASPSEFNDPFEIKRNYTYPKNAAMVRYLKKTYGHKFNMKEPLQALTNSLRKIHDLFAKNTTENTNNFGVLCMTPYPDNILMWSHYGDSHRGICFGFDIEQPFDKVFGNSHQVIYDKNYPSLCLLDHYIAIQNEFNGDLDSDLLKDIGEKNYFTKSDEWAYEQEIRFVRFNSGVGSQLMSFPKQKIKELIIGANVELDVEESIKKYCRNELPHVSVKKLLVAKDKYKLVFK